MFSQAKWAAARARISFSISSCRFLRRSSASSFFSALVGRVLLPSSSASPPKIPFVSVAAPRHAGPRPGVSGRKHRS